MKGEDALSPENRALIERDAGCSFKQYAPGDVLQLCAADLNRLLNAARLQAPCVGKEGELERLRSLCKAADAPEPPRPTLRAALMDAMSEEWEAWADAKAMFTSAAVDHVRALLAIPPARAGATEHKDEDRLRAEDDDIMPGGFS